MITAEQDCHQDMNQAPPTLSSHPAGALHKLLLTDRAVHEPSLGCKEAEQKEKLWFQQPHQANKCLGLGTNPQGKMVLTSHYLQNLIQLFSGLLLELLLKLTQNQPRKGILRNKLPASQENPELQKLCPALIRHRVTSCPTD